MRARSEDLHSDRGDGRGDYAITQHEFAPMRRTDRARNDVRNAIECATVSATRIEIVLNEFIVEGQDRVLTLPWTRASSRRRREIIQGVGEAQGPLRAMRTKARDSFIRALGDARRWLDELLIDPAQTIESLAMREHKSERSIRMTVSLAFVSPVLAEAALEGDPANAARPVQGPNLGALAHALNWRWIVQVGNPGRSRRLPGGAEGMLHWGRRFTNSFLADALNSRGIVGAGNPGRFAPTSWWCAQSSQTGLWRTARKVLGFRGTPDQV